MALDLKTMKFTLLAGYDDVDIRSFHWVNEHRVVFDLIDLHAPIEDRNKYAWGLYAVNTDGSMLRQLVDRQWSPWIERGGERPLLPWYTYFLRPVGDATTNDIWVYKIEEFDKTHVDYLQLEKVDTMRGRAIDIDTPPHTTGWVFDAKGELRVATVENDNHLKVMARDVDAGTWSVLGDFDRFFDDKAFAPGYIDETGTLYVSAYNGNDKAAVWTYDLSHHKMADKPFLVSQRYDLAPRYLVAHGKLAGLRYDVDAEVTQWIAPDLEALQAKLDKLLPSTVNRLSVAPRGDGRFVVIHAFSDHVPGLYFLYDVRDNRLVTLGNARPDIDPESRRHGASALRRARRPRHPGLPDRAARRRAQEPAAGDAGARRPVRARPRVGLGSGGPVPSGTGLCRLRARVSRQHRLRREAVHRRLEAMGPGDAGRYRRRGQSGRSRKAWSSRSASASPAVAMAATPC